MTAQSATGASPAPVRRRRRPQGQTRERLVEAAVSLLAREGPAAVSTTRLAAEVGIVQSGFYAHFGSVDECLAEACRRVVDEARAPITEWMGELAATDSGDLERLTAHFARVLDLLVPRWQAVELVLRHQRDPGPLGQQLAEVGRTLDRDVHAYLRSIADVLPDPLPRAAERRLALLAHLAVGLVMSALEAIADEPGLDRAAVARSLAVASHHMVGSALEELAAGG